MIPIRISDPSDLRSLILIRIIPKERTQSDVPTITICVLRHDRELLIIVL